jgi:hypothetical protein
VSREYLCEAGNCQSTKTPYGVTFTDDSGFGESFRKRFCSLKHLSEWASRRAQLDAGYAREQVESAYK